MKREKIVLATKRGPETVSALTVGPLGIHRTHPKANIGFSITHIPSGAKVLSRINNQAVARDVLRHLLAWPGCDWFAMDSPVPAAVRPAILDYLRTVPRKFHDRTQAEIAS